MMTKNFDKKDLFIYLLHYYSNDNNIINTILDTIIHRTDYDINTRCTNSMTPLSYVIDTGNCYGWLCHKKLYYDVIKHLIHIGANPFIKDNTGKNAFDYARISDVTYDQNITDILVENNKYYTNTRILCNIII